MPQRPDKESARQRRQMRSQTEADTVTTPDNPPQDENCTSQNPLGSHEAELFPSLLFPDSDSITKTRRRSHMTSDPSSPAHQRSRSPEY
ncbi:hypothetical protein SRHO_G00328380 [Serrasalmus rhombeus]